MGLIGCQLKLTPIALGLRCIANCFSGVTGAFGVVTDRWSLLGVYYYQSGAHYFISWLLDVEIGRRP